MFIDPDAAQLDAAWRMGAPVVEFHTGTYANACLRHDDEEAKRHLRRLEGSAARAQGQYALKVNAGHGLNYRNVKPVACIDGMRELNIGHAIVSHAVFVGLERAVREMVALINEA
jgi:pyridoxine 5-phosphate synthase